MSIPTALFSSLTISRQFYVKTCAASRSHSKLHFGWPPEQRRRQLRGHFTLRQFANESALLRATDQQEDLARRENLRREQQQIRFASQRSHHALHGLAAQGLVVIADAD